MKNIFGISFSDTRYDIAHSIHDEKVKIVSLKSFQYPFPFNYDNLFNEDNIQVLAATIHNHKLEKGLEELDLVVSLPVNYIFSKRVALPLNADAELTSAQVKWELGNYLQGKLTDYKIVKKEQVFFEAYKEIHFIAIRHELFNKLQELTSNTHTRLGGIKTDSDSLLAILMNNYSEKETNNQFVLCVDDKTLSTYLYIQGSYYQSFLDIHDGNQDLLLELCQKRYQLGAEILDTFPNIENNEYNVYLAGSGSESGLLEMLREHFVENIVAVKIENESINSGSLKAVGVVL